MELIPNTENACVLRTDFSNQPAWEKICRLIQRPVGISRFRANLASIDDTPYEGLSIDQLFGLLPHSYDHLFIILADQTSVSHPDHPLLVVDLYEGSGNSFRAVPSTIQSIENNLAIAHMDFEKFSSAVDANGFFRGFHRG